MPHFWWTCAILSCVRCSAACRRTANGRPACLYCRQIGASGLSGQPCFDRRAAHHPQMDDRRAGRWVCWPCHVDRPRVSGRRGPVCIKGDRTQTSNEYLCDYQCAAVPAAIVLQRNPMLFHSCHRAIIRSAHRPPRRSERPKRRLPPWARAMSIAIESPSPTPGPLF